MKEIKLNLTNEQVSILRNSLLSMASDIRHNTNYNIDNDLHFNDLISQIYKNDDDIDWDFYQPWESK